MQNYILALSLASNQVNSTRLGINAFSKFTRQWVSKDDNPFNPRVITNQLSPSLTQLTEEAGPLNFGETSNPTAGSRDAQHYITTDANPTSYSDYEKTRAS